MSSHLLSRFALVTVIVTVVTFCLPGAASAQFTATDWNVATYAQGYECCDGTVPANPDPLSVVDNLAADGFRYFAKLNTSTYDNTGGFVNMRDRHVVSQKLASGPLELSADGDRVTLSFNIKMNAPTDITGNGSQNLRFAMFDSTQNSDFVNTLDAAKVGSGGADNFAFYGREKISAEGLLDNGGNEQLMGFSTFIGSPGATEPASGLSFEDYGLVPNALGGILNGTALRNNTGGNVNDFPDIYVGYDTSHVYNATMQVTRMNQGLYLLETNILNVTTGADGFSGDANERVYSDLWRDPTDDSLGFDGFSFTVNNNGVALDFDATVSNLSLSKENLGPVGVNSQGIFHVDFLSRQDWNNTGGRACNQCWIEQDNDGGVDNFTWAPFILQGDADEPIGGFTNPTLTYKDTFGAGKDLTITVDTLKVDQEQFGNTPSQTRLGANYLSSLGSGDSATSVTLEGLPAGDYTITTYHHIRTGSADSLGDIELTDAIGSNVLVGDDIMATFNNSEASEIGNLTFSATSDGVNPVVIQVTNVGVGDYPLNGLTIIPPVFEGIIGDYSGNGLVEQADLDLVLLNWGGPADPVPAGWKNDPPTPESIDQDDLDRVLLNWGKSAAASAAQAVPEPSAMALLILAAMGLVGFGRTRR